MSFGPRQHLLPILLGLLVCWLTISPATGHEPLDVSFRITIYEDRLELVSTLGTEGMRQLLSAAGLSPEVIAENLKARGPDVPVEYPNTLAAQFFELRNNREPLGVKRIKSVSEGAEIILTLSYPRPVEGTLQARAACYETVPGLHAGLLIIHNEDGKRLGATLLSRERIQMTVTR